MDIPDKYEFIPFARLREPLVVMRPVRRDSIEFLERRDSLRREGPLNSILVRPDPRHPGDYEVIDGNYRRVAGPEAGLEGLPAIIKFGLTDERALAMQLQANAVRMDTEPLEYCRQLRRIEAACPGMTMAELGRIAGKSAGWIREQLGLLVMSKDIQAKIDRGDIPIASARMLAKIPLRWRLNYVEAAMTLPIKEFTKIAAGVVKQFKECRHQGKLDDKYLPPWKPQAFLRGVVEVKEELEKPQQMGLILIAEDCKTLPDAVKATLQWVLNLDKKSVDAQLLKARKAFRVIEDQETEASHEALD